MATVTASGNFRELRNWLGVLLLHAEPGGRLAEGTIRDAFEDFRSDPNPAIVPGGAHTAAPPVPFTAEEERERQALQAALAEHGGNRSKAACSLGMDRTTLWRKLHRLRIVPDRAPG